MPTSALPADRGKERCGHRSLRGGAHFSPDDEIHRGEAGARADELADKLGPEDALDAQAQAGQQQGQGGHQDQLAQGGEEEGVLGMVQGHEGMLARDLEGHKGEGAEVDPGAADRQAHQGLVVGEDPDQQLGEEHGHDPHEGVDGQAAQEDEADTLGDPAVLLRPVVVAHNGLAALGDAVDGQAHDLAHGVDEAHGPDVELAEWAAPGLEHDVDDGLGDGVRDLEHKSGDAQLDHVFQLGGVDPHPAQADRGPLSRQEAEDPEGADGLGEDRRQGRAPDAHVKEIDEEGVQDDVQRRADDYRHHAHPGEALGVDEGVHAQADEDRDGSDHIDAEIVHGVGQAGLVAAQDGQGPGGRREEQDRQRCADEQQEAEGRLHDPPGPLVVPLAPGDGAERSAAGAAEIGKGADQRNQREADAQARQSNGALRLRQVADVHPVHDVVEHVDQLGQHDGQSQLHDQRRDLALGKITFYYRHYIS